MSDQMVVFSFLTVIIVVPTLAHYWSHLRIKEWEMSLKHAMLERGMSALEIERVLQATGKGTSGKGQELETNQSQV